MFNVGLFLNVCIITFASFYPYMQSFIFFNKTGLHWSSLCKETGKQMRLVEILRENTDVLGLFGEKVLMPYYLDPDSSHFQGYFKIHIRPLGI